MKNCLSVKFTLGLAAALLVQTALLGAANELTPAEKSEGWKLLFDGTSLHGWRNFKKLAPPQKGWVVHGESLMHLTKGGGGDIITDSDFGDFELKWEWKVAPGANSGLKYFVTEERSSAIGHEYQLIDDTRHPDAKLAQGKRVTASFYDVLKPLPTQLKPVGDWNESEVLVRGKHVEHWLNGQKVLSYDLESAELKAAISLSKFKNTPRFGTQMRGHILLQDHGDEISFRNLKIREF